VDQDIKEKMAELCDKLTPTQIDDCESRYDNLSVLVDKVLDEYDIGGEHCPGLDEHIHNITHAIVEAIRIHVAQGGEASVALRNSVMQVFWFGYEAGKVNWPLPRMSCEDVHS
jgi:hypothetical protein